MLNFCNTVQDFKNGCEKAFEKIYFLYNDKVFYLCVRIGVNNSDAEDIVQETFFQLWEQKDHIDPEKSLEGLIKMIARRKSYKYFENNNNKNLSFNEAIYMEDFTEEKVDNLFQKENLKQVKRAIENLPESKKQIIKLYYIEGLSIKEISHLRNITVRTVENQLYRAKKNLKKSFEC